MTRKNDEFYFEKEDEWKKRAENIVLFIAGLSIVILAIMLCVAFPSYCS